MRRSSILVIAVMMASLFVSGCKKAAEKAAEKAIEAGMAKDGTKGKVDISGGKVSIETKDGTAVYAGGKDAKVPDNFPKDVYVYDGGTVMASISVPDGFNLTIESKDSSDKILSAVKGKMTGFGWKQEMEMKQNNNSMISYKKGERSATINIASDSKGSQISIFASNKK